MEEKKKKREEITKERGANDDWEALKIILDELPSLKQRVLHRLRELKDERSSKTSGVTVSKRELQKNKLANQKKGK